MYTLLYMQSPRPGGFSGLAAFPAEEGEITSEKRLSLQPEDLAPVGSPIRLPRRNLGENFPKIWSAVPRDAVPPWAMGFDYVGIPDERTLNARQGLPAIQFFYVASWDAMGREKRRSPTDDGVMWDRQVIAHLRDRIARHATPPMGTTGGIDELVPLGHPFVIYDPTTPNPRELLERIRSPVNHPTNCFQPMARHLFPLHATKGIRGVHAFQAYGVREVAHTEGEEDYHEHHG